MERKIKRLFKRAGHPRWFHHMGLKKFESWILCLGIVIKQVYRLSYGRAARFLDDYFTINVHFTMLQKVAKRLPKSLWQSLLAAIIMIKEVPLAVANGTGFSRSGSSEYFLKRIDRDGLTGRSVQAVVMIGVQQRNFFTGTFFCQTLS